LIAFDSYGQSSSEFNNQDSIKISIPEFFEIERMRRGHSLLKIQYNELTQSNTQKSIIILSQEIQLKQQILKFNTTKEYSDKLLKKYRKVKTINFFLKIAIPSALVGGFMIAK
jgi:hypothetical protein